MEKFNLNLSSNSLYRDRMNITLLIKRLKGMVGLRGLELKLCGNRYREDELELEGF